MARTFITRLEYDQWVNDAAALARALRFPITDDMINDSAGIVYGDSQYEAFEKGLWSGDPYEVMIIFQALNEPAVDGLPADAGKFAEYSGLCDKLMIMHPGKYCPPHFHPRKTESYEVLMGEMEVFYSPDEVSGFGETLRFEGMPTGDEWPEGVAIPEGRDESYAGLTRFVRLKAGDPKFVMHRKHLHAFRCAQDSKVPLVVREISTYSHEPTEDQKDDPVPLESWRGLHDNTFLADEANLGRLVTHIV